MNQDDDAAETPEPINDEKLRSLLNSACCGGYGEQLIHELIARRANTVPASIVDTHRLSEAQRVAGQLTTAIRNMANERAGLDHGGWPGPADLDDLTDQAKTLEDLLDALTA